MATLPLKLYMIPGSGTDYRIFTAQTEQFPDMIIPKWLPPLTRKESLESYCERLSRTIDVSSPFALGGLSLGGMVAQQLALTLKPAAVILISTGSSYKDLTLSGRLTGRIMRMLPDKIIGWLFSIASKAVMKTKSRRKAGYARMLSDMPPHLVRWQSGVATDWTLKKALTMPVFHIHGDKDPVIPLKNVKASQIVVGGGHLINATHENEVNQFIAASLAKVTPFK